MRLKEDLKKTGYFWLPSKPEMKIPGALTIADGGNIELEVVGLFDESSEGIGKALSGEDKLERIVGHIEKNDLVTLEGCFYRCRNISFGGISKSNIQANRAFIGVAYEVGGAIRFNEVQFSVEGLDEWVGLSGIKVEQNVQERSASITYLRPDEVSLDLNNGMRLVIAFSWTPPSFSCGKEARITQKTYLRLVAENERPLDDFVLVAHKIATLLCFAVDKAVCIDRMSAASNSLYEDFGSGNQVPISVSVFYQSLLYTKNEPKIDKHSMLFEFGRIANNAERIVNRWLEACNDIDPALNLYFAAKRNDYKYLDGRFLALAQGLETYHRRTSKDKLMDDIVFRQLSEKLVAQCPIEHREWLSGRLAHGNEISLARRIKSVIEPFKELFGNSWQRNKLIRSIVETRNYLTHYDESLKMKAAFGKDLWLLCLKMEVIFQLHLLHVVGFTGPEIKSVFANSYQLQGKIRQT